MHRVSCGLEGLDSALSGGFPKGSVVLLTGGPGSGKTTLCSHFVEEGLRKDQKALFISTGQKPSEIKKQAADRNIELEGENLSTAHISPSKDVADDIREKVARESFDRIVLDSLSIFEMFWGEQDQLRKYINKLMEHFRDLDATVVVTSERRSESEGLTRFGVAEFLTDGVIELRGFAMGRDQYRSLRLIKMRGTGISSAPLAVDLGSEGMKVSEVESI